MAGIRVSNPTGDDWEYSLDTVNWQYNPVFNSLPDGSPFVSGEIYPVYSRNLVLESSFVDTIEFSAKDNDDTLDVVVRRGAKGKQGWTDALVKLMGGLFLDKIPTTTLDYPRLVIAPDGRVYKYGGTVNETPDPLFSFVHWQAVATAKTEKSRAVVGNGSITELILYNAKLIVTYSDNSTEDRTAFQNWYFYADTFQNGQKDYYNTTGAYTLDADTVDGPGHTGTVRAVERINGVDVVRDLPVTIINAAIDPAGSVDVHNCDDIQGWCADKNNPGKPYSVRIEINGQYVDTVTAQYERTEVGPIIGVPALKICGWRYKLPEVYKNNQEHNLKVFLGDTQKECTYNTPLSLICNAPTAEPQPTGDYYIAGEEPIREAGDGVVQTLKQVLNNGLDRNYPGNDVIWSKPGGPAGLNLATTGDRQVLVSLGANSIDATGYQNIQAQIPGKTVTKRLQLINTDCSRPTGLGYSPKLVFNFASGGQARLFNSLDDANNTMGKHFAGVAAGTFAPFEAMMADYNRGTTVYLGWGTDCAVVSNNIYYVLNGDASNGQKIAIQTVDGKIVDVKVSNYSSEIRPPNTGDCVGYGKLTQAQYDALPFRFPPDQQGFAEQLRILEYVDDTQAVNSVDRVRTFKTRAEALAQIANPNGKSAFDVIRTSPSAGFAVGNTIYGNNDPILRPTNEGYYWPIEAGFVACEMNSTQYVLLTLNNCGQITNRETIQK